MSAIRSPEPDTRTPWRALVGAAMLLLAGTAAAGPLEFSLHVNQGERAGPTVLMIGGIQGDEPGEFNAASLLVTHYRMRRGSVWVVPNLNFESIVRRSRGVHGDMNRRFPDPPQDDPDFARVDWIKRIITDQQVDYVFNLHDGSGFFRQQHHDRMRNPRRRGQSIIIDQESMDRSPHAPLGGLERVVSAKVNDSPIDGEDRINVKNTRTREGNREMAKTSTFFAINQGKPAVGLEAGSPLVAAVDAGGSYSVSYGNRRVTDPHPQFFEYDASIDAVGMELDGIARTISVGTLVEVRDRFSVQPTADVRVNVIGWRAPNGGSEDGTEIRRGEIAQRFSVDEAGRAYRVEFYRGGRFAGMILVRFADGETTALHPATPGPLS